LVNNGVLEHGQIGYDEDLFDGHPCSAVQHRDEHFSAKIDRQELSCTRVHNSSNPQT